MAIKPFSKNRSAERFSLEFRKPLLGTTDFQSMTCSGQRSEEKRRGTPDIAYFRNANGITYALLSARFCNANRTLTSVLCDSRGQRTIWTSSSAQKRRDWTSRG